MCPPFKLVTDGGLASREKTANEDVTLCVPFFINMDEADAGASAADSEDGYLHLFGVFDGHGGRCIAEHCAATLPRHLRDVLSELLGASPPTSSRPALVEQALCTAFERTDQDLKNVKESACCGSTALLVVVGRRDIWTAHCGDSRAVLCRSSVATALTSDHSPRREDELARIERAGGMILWNRGHRVMGVLATTRSMGDHDLKAYGVCPSPETSHVARGPDDDFLILASDGLWGRHGLDSQGACDVVHRCMESAARRGKSRKVAKAVANGMLTTIARESGSTDDITIIIVDLKSPHRRMNRPVPVPAGGASAELRPEPPPPLPGNPSESAAALPAESAAAAPDVATSQDAGTEVPSSSDAGCDSCDAGGSSSDGGGSSSRPEPPTLPPTHELPETALVPADPRGCASVVLQALHSVSSSVCSSKSFTAGLAPKFTSAPFLYHQFETARPLCLRVPLPNTDPGAVVAGAATAEEGRTGQRQQQQQLQQQGDDMGDSLSRALSLTRAYSTCMGALQSYSRRAAIDALTAEAVMTQTQRRSHDGGCAAASARQAVC